MNPLSRRDALALGAAAIAAPVLGRRRALRSAAASGAPSLPDYPFALGVNSGDPDSRSVVIWTRLTAVDGAALDVDDIEVTWELSTDASFANVTSSGTATASADTGHSVHAVVDVDGPCWYRFTVGEWTSPVGRAAPTPSGDARELRIATASCQHFETGFYAAHRDIAEWQPDLVLFLGDFIYEYGSSDVGGVIVRSHESAEIRAIDDYRARYARYLGDADLQASRAACPWLTVWDDHEVENNYAALAPEDPSDTGVFAARRLAAYQAWWEHMPVRLARPERGDEFTIYRSVAWGNLAKVVLLDGRQYRSDQACGDATLDTDAPCPDALAADRTMLGSEQEAWLAGELADVRSRWMVLGQQTVMSDLRLPNGAIINYDQWDGYAPARSRLLLAATRAERVIVLTGDIHIAGVGRLPGVGAEFITTGISSTAPEIPADMAESIGDLFPDMVAAEFASRGYTRHTVSADEWVAEFRTVHDAADPTSTVSTWRTFAVEAESRDVVLER